MNCSDTKRLISAARDGTLDDKQRSVLDAHVESCPGCRQFQSSLAAAADAWRSNDVSIQPPDVAREWMAIRRRLRGAGEQPASVADAGRHPARWFGLSLGAVAACCLAVVVALNWPGPRLQDRIPQPAEAEYVEIQDDTGSVVVFLDDESGWLVVWSVPELIETGI